eukprot:m.355344 g.355344  ORF g.355344 m.355344 type:complete len:72 (-) comp16597_c1_seq33:237-452(-)
MIASWHIQNTLSLATKKVTRTQLTQRCVHFRDVSRLSVKDPISTFTLQDNEETASDQKSSNDTSNGKKLSS